MWQELVVALVVVLAFVYVGAKYLPAAWRLRVVNCLSRGGAESKLVRWLHMGAGSGGSCGGGCKTCDTCATPAGPAAPDGGKHRVIRVHEKR